MKQSLKDLAKSFNDCPAWTVWSLMWAPFVYTLIFMTALTVALVNFSVSDGVDFWNDAT